MRTVFIKESMLNNKLLRESILMNALPDDIVSVIGANKTSLGNNPSIPDIFDDPFLLRIANRRFGEVKEELKSIGRIDDVEETDMESVLSHLIQICREIERPRRNELEKICFNILVEMFDIPDDTIQLEISLVDKIDFSSTSINLDPMVGDGDDGLVFDDINDAMAVKDEVFKRRMLDVLCMGAAIQLSSNIDFYKDEIDNVDTRLCDLYRKIIALNNYMLFSRENISMTDEDKKQLGTSEVTIGSDDEKNKVWVSGLIFPSIFAEGIKSIMELVVAHGLPDDKQRAIAILQKSDYLKAEPWDMRLGPSLWTLLSDSFERTDITGIPYIMKSISTLDTDKFSTLMREIFAQTTAGKRMMSSICDDARREIEYSGFEDRMDKKRAEKEIITDEFIHPNEL